MLIGIVKKNAIMQIDFALEAERKEGKSPRDAIYEGCLIRFRPIMMTTMAALLGGAADRAGLRRGRRSAAAAGPGGGRRPVFSQLMTLYLTPVVYTYMAAIRRSRWNDWKAASSAQDPKLMAARDAGGKIRTHEYFPDLY